MIEEKYKNVADFSCNGIEAIKRTGVRVVEMRDRYVKMLMPIQGNVNHVGIMYAGALFGLGEVIGGALFGAAFDYMKYVPIAKEVSIRYRRPALTDVTLVAEISEEDVARIDAELREKDKADIPLDLELKDAQEEVVAIVHGTWQARRIPDGFVIPWAKAQPAGEGDSVMKHIRLFEPIRINRLAVENRAVMPAMGLHYTDDYTFSDRYSAFYRTRAHGGVGLMIVGPLAVDLYGGAPVMPGLFDDRNMKILSALNAELHRDTKAKIGVQLFHMGRNAPTRLFTGEPPLAPSAVRSRLTGDVPKAMTEEDIDRVQVSFARAAERAVAAGFDFVEIIACTGYLVSQFLSPLTNLRTDGYGGSWENRMRFGLELIRRVRTAVGPDIALGIRVAGNDFMEGSNTNAESALFCAEAEKAGVDAVNVTGGWHETLVPQLTQGVPPGAYAYLARGIREKVSVPVFASNRLGDPDVAERVLRSGAADMICWGRPLIADPDLPRKVREGRFDEIIRCVSCNQGCFDSIFLGRGIFCAVNPTVGHEGEPPAAKSPQRKKVFVAGGGPAGMQFALTASGRGHAVTIFEKEESLGGQIPVAAGPPSKEELLHIRDGMARRLGRTNVEIRFGRSLTAEDVKREQPDVVVVATGAEPIAIRVPGMDKPHVADAWDVLRGDVARIGKRVVVVGGNAVGCETAEWIATDGLPDPETFMFLACHGAETTEKLQSLGVCNGRRITVIDMVDRIGANVGPSTRWVLMQSLKRHGVELRTGTRLVEILDDAVVVETGAGQERIEADTVVMAVGSRSVNGLVEELRPLGVEVIVVGDAKAPRKFSDAIAEGYAEARNL